ncbi:MAG: aldo/keto reductase [Oscillospiraceae bacterium]|jgi:aryl-alcohol dehydrogenase-like predicted oxidoreductase|nr:aldo/keto reductase [Oscillospiraceae bacterium]
MQVTALGRTGAPVTVAGLGCGGFSRIGIDKGPGHAAGIVRSAYESGVNFFDTAYVYGTQEAVGRGLAGVSRDKYVLSSKFPYRSMDGRRLAPEDISRCLDESLRLLGTDYIDIWHIHALDAGDYEWAKSALLPVMHSARESGKIRFLGVTEQFAVDTSHEMLKLALPEALFDVVMAGYNILNPSAAKTVLPVAAANGTAVLCMFAVRSALHDPKQLRVDIGRILDAGQGGAGLSASSLDFIVGSGAARSLPEAAYRFCRHAPGITVTLTGTGNAEHLRENLAAINAPPLPEDVMRRLGELFGNVDCVSGQ